MYKISGTCCLLTFLAVPTFAFAQNPPTITSLSPEVSISVHDYADVPTALLAAAEVQAREIFRHAGLETVWLNCSPKLEREKLEPGSCYFSDTTHLTLKISPRAMNAQFRNRRDVLGTAYPDEKGTGYFAYVFYDRIQELAQRRRLGHALLADVMTHEIGHLLLGSTSHSASGIMCAHWNYEELRNVSEGAMSFVPAQSRVMRDQLHAHQSERLEQAPDARRPKIAATATTSPQEDPPLQRFVCNTGYTQEKCHEDMTVLRRTLAKYPLVQLGDWTWILVRSEDWKAIVTPRGLDPDSPAFTYYAKRQTFVEEALVADLPGRRKDLKARWHMPVERLLYLAVGHELGHALCNDRSEEKANQTAQMLRAEVSPPCEMNPEARAPVEKLRKQH